MSQRKWGEPDMEITHSDITGQIVRYFKDNIVSGEWKVGEKIPSENQLTQMLGVSRASVRTAIQQMVGIGVLESVHGKGTYLKDDQVEDVSDTSSKITSEDCRDIEKVLEFRRIVESEACRLAAQNADDAFIKELEKWLSKMKDSINKREAFVTADVAFHKAISRASGNLLLEKSLYKVFEEKRKDHSQMNEIFGYKDGIYYHSMILEAIKAGDAQRARDCMFEHLQNAINRLHDV